MNILVLGGGYRNKGNEAMLRVVQRELSRRVRGANMFALLDPSEHALAYASGLVPMSIGDVRLHRFVGGAIASRAAVSRFLIRRRSLWRLARSLFSYQETRDLVLPRMLELSMGGIDAVVDVHGYAFGDPWSLRGFKAAAQWGAFCRRHGKPYCFMPQTWGPFEKSGYASAAVNVVRHAKVYYARECLSQAALAVALGKEVGEIPVAPDTVLRFASGPLSLGEEVLRRSGVIRQGRPLIGITPNMRVYERTNGIGAANDYVQLLCRLCDHFVESLGANVVLIPNEISPVLNVKSGTARIDDRFLCSLVAANVRKPTGCFALREYHSAEEVHSAIGCLDLLVGSRFHTLVFALSSCIPVVALGWAQKYDGLLRQFELGAHFVHCGQMKEGAVLDLVSRTWDDRASVARCIRAALPRIQSAVDAVFDHVASAMVESVAGAKMSRSV